MCYSLLVGVGGGYGAGSASHVWGFGAAAAAAVHMLLHQPRGFSRGEPEWQVAPGWPPKSPPQDPSCRGLTLWYCRVLPRLPEVTDIGSPPA